MKYKYVQGLLMLSLLGVTITMSALKFSGQDEKPNAGLTLPQGFSAVKLIEGIGKVRHIAITQNAIFTHGWHAPLRARALCC